MLIKSLISMLSPSGDKARLTVLIFHRVAPVADPLFPGELDAARFDRMLMWLKSCFSVLSLADGVDKLRSGILPRNALAISFDDGYRDNLTIAAPLLQKHGLPATVFVSTGFLDGGVMFNDLVVESVRGFCGDRLDLDDLGMGVLATGGLDEKRHAIGSILRSIKYLPPEQRMALAQKISVKAGLTKPIDLMMTSDELRALHRGGVAIGGHTHSHPILARISDDEARQEIQLGKNVLESIIDEQVSLFAYPNGKLGTDFREEHAVMAREAGYTAAFTTEPGSAGASGDTFQLPRFTPWDKTSLGFCGRILLGKIRDASAHQRVSDAVAKLGTS